MEDKNLDRILQHALTPEINDEEIKVKFEKKVEKERVIPMKKKLVRPAIALAACAALVAGIGFGNLPEQIMSNTNLSNKTDTSAGKGEQSVQSGFVMKVKAAEVKEKELKQGESEAVVSFGQTDDGSEGWIGSVDGHKVSYCISMPLVCEGENIDTVTYSVDKGCFRILQPKNDPYVIDGEECEASMQVNDAVKIDLLPENGEKMEEKYYKSYTVAAKDQNRKDVEVYLCNTKTLSEELYNRLWDKNCGMTEEELVAEAAVKNKVMDKPQITCKINYQDGADRQTETAKVAVEQKVMTYKEAAGNYQDQEFKKKLELIKDEKGLFVTFERL